VLPRVPEVGVNAYDSGCLQVFGAFDNPSNAASLGTPELQGACSLSAYRCLSTVEKRPFPVLPAAEVQRLSRRTVTPITSNPSLAICILLAPVVTGVKLNGVPMAL
jgi:hypothetical protein